MMQTPRFWREIEERYTLKGVKCGSCNATLFPTRTLCPECRHASVGKLTPFKLSGEGTVEAVTTVYTPPAGFELQAPYVLALVRLAEGPRVTAQVVDAKPDAVKVGAKVRAVFRRINEEGEAGVIQYGYKFTLQA
jgi:uncharacterized OB-fold protein